MSITDSAKQNPQPDPEQQKEFVDETVTDDRRSKPAVQIVFEVILFGGGGLLAFGAILDAFSNALTIITTRVTIVGTVIVAVIAGIALAARNSSSTLTETKDYRGLFRWGRKQWSALIGVVFLLWTPFWLRALTGPSEDRPSAHEKSASNVNQSSPQSIPSPILNAPKITFSYMRLFGGFQVPKLFDESADWVVPFDFRVSNEWWRSRFPDAVLLRDPLWAQVKEAQLDLDNSGEPGGIVSTKLWRIVFRGNLGEAKENLDKLLSLAVESMDEELSPERQKSIEEETKKVMKFFEQWTSRIGFIFLVIDWDSEMIEAKEARLFYKELPNAFGAHLSKEVADSSLQSAELKSIVIPTPRTPTKQLWLLSVYEKDRDGFPLEYVSTILEPQYLTVQVENGTQQYEIRKPYGKNAAKIDLPLGWYWQ